ncbi:RCC1 domain-containing protein [Actinocrispum wychmicini]|uniref:Alpha-tubulin suppressor-like RCC1 family protein n=1 Tax=Actinocrispum wychmicini TaxID=1213861 RepID=A0A4R2JLM7_9PSEU|nr:RCC1 domain-containing protein [Actinocrispum wychmicini]TCO57958.1 alpha-tubulin suppressor-like RCC1 family protein [Actinocrispum wychmicini]
MRHRLFTAHWLTVILALLVTAVGIVPVQAVAAPGRDTSSLPEAPTRGLREARAAMMAATPVSTGAKREAKASAAVSGAPAGSLYTPLAPTRVLDTRNGTGGVRGPVGPRSSIVLDLSGRVPASATAVVLNVTGTDVTNATFITVFPDGDGQPLASNLNLAPGDIRPNLTTVAVSPSGKVRLYNDSGSVDLVADLAGYYAPQQGAGYTSRVPVRVLDTRNGTGGVGAGGTVTVDVSTLVPASATAVTFNLTGILPSQFTFVTAWPHGTPRPVASNLNLGPGAITPNLVTVTLGQDRKVDLYNDQGVIHLLADLAGYYAPGVGDAFFQLAPQRVLDTRYDPVAVGPDSRKTVSLGRWLPPTATAVVANLTGTGPTDPTYITMWPTGQGRPNASNLNLAAGQTAPNLAVAQLDRQSQQVDLYNSQGHVDLILDLAGYFGAAPAAPCTSQCAYAWGSNAFGQLANGTTGGYSSTPGQMAGLSGVTLITGDNTNGYAVLADGTTRSWGDNAVGQLANDWDNGMSTVPVKVDSTGTSLDTPSALVSVGWTAYAVSTSRPFSWGYGANGERGMGIDPSGGYNYPIQIWSLPPIKQVASAFGSGFFLDTSGAVWVTGINGGLFGNGDFGTGCDTLPVAEGCRTLSPQKVPGLTNVVSIAAGWNTAYAITSDGTVYGWGWNAEGQLALGTQGGSACYQNRTLPDCVALSPVKIPALTGVKRIVGGLSTDYAVKADGSVSAWGWNFEGQVGNGTFGQDCVNHADGANCVVPSPVAVSGLAGVSDLAAGALFAEALLPDGTVWTWGSSRYGQVGRPTDSSVPTQVAGLSGVTAIGVGGWTGYAVTS